MVIARYAALTCVALLVGCGSAPDDRWTKNRPKVYPASGTVTYKGSPVADAVVVFSPNSGSRGAQAKTGADGTYKLTTFDKDDGATIGSFQVTVSKLTVTETQAPTSNMRNVPPPVVKHELPKKYSDPKTSGLNYSVSEDPSKNVFPLELKD